MTLLTHLKSSGVRTDDLAKRVGVTRYTLERYARGELFPKPEIVIAIYRETRGDVRPQDWYTPLSSWQKLSAKLRRLVAS